MAGTIKGMNVRIGGDTSGLQDAINKANKDIQNTQKELKAVDKLLKLDPKNVDLLRKKQQLLTQQIGNTTTKLEALKEKQRAFDEAIAKGGNVSQEKYRELQHEISKTEIDLNSLKDTQSKTNEALSGGSNKLELLKTAMSKVGSGAVALTAQLVSLTVTGIKAMATATVTAVSSLATLAIKAGQSADDLNALATVTGLSTEQLQKFAYASDLIDVSMDTLTGSLKKLTMSMSKAQSGTGTQADAFKKLGVNIKDAQGNLRDNEDVFNDVIRALGNIGNETERDALAMDLFGKSATELNPLIEGGIDTLDEMRKESKRAWTYSFTRGT